MLYIDHEKFHLHILLVNMHYFDHDDIIYGQAVSLLKYKLYTFYVYKSQRFMNALYVYIYFMIFVRYYYLWKRCLTSFLNYQSVKVLYRYYIETSVSEHLLIVNTSY